MPGHSLQSPVDVTSLAEKWWLGGTAIPSKNNIVLNPGVPGRVGLLWSPHQVLTNNFAVSLRLLIKGPEKRTVQEDGVAFWYVSENASAAMRNVTTEYIQNQDSIVANTWPLALLDAGFDRFGYRSKFDGLGVAVLNDNGAGKVVASHNDGTKVEAFGVTPEALAFDRSKEVNIHIRVQPTEAVVTVDGKTITLKGAFKVGGYIGMTVGTGKKGTLDAAERSDVIELKEFKVDNHDQSVKGEALPEVIHKEGPAKPAENALAESSSFKDHRAESDAIKDLTNMVFKLIVETQPIRQQLQTAITSITQRMDAMEATFDHLKQAIDQKTGHHLGQEFESIKKELATLSSVASQETHERHKRLENLHSDITEVHKNAHSKDSIDHHLNKLTETNARTLDNLTNDHQKMFGISIAAIAFVIIAGLSLYNKFRCWEKKHIL